MITASVMKELNLVNISSEIWWLSLTLFEALYSGVKNLNLMQRAIKKIPAPWRRGRESTQKRNKTIRLKERVITKAIYDLKKKKRVSFLTRINSDLMAHAVTIFWSSTSLKLRKLSEPQAEEMHHALPSGIDVRSWTSFIQIISNQNAIISGITLIKGYFRKKTIFCHITTFNALWMIFFIYEEKTFSS